MNKLLPLDDDAADRRARVGLVSASGAALADSPLADAIENGRRDAALELIAEGADVNAAQGDGTTPLHWAAYKLDPELVQLLLDRGAKADTQNRYGASPLGEAVKAANAEHRGDAARCRRERRTRRTRDGETVADARRAHGLRRRRDKLLVAHGADVNAREAWRDQTALMWAAEGAFPELTTS